jgi:pantoate--beta-alanine ligase
MGALHEGHASLVRLAQAARSGPVVVSIFVNPTQFNEASDFERYPRTLESDTAICQSLGADAVFAPEVEEMYPRGVDIPVGELPQIATRPGLEDAHRPGHFAGVCQVVRRLFRLVQPNAAVFGEKDWQQLQVIQAMVVGEGLGVRVIPGPTLRERDGLAMSSRNRLLQRESRLTAGSIPLALEAARREREPSAAEGAMLACLERSGLAVEYAVVRDAGTLLGYRPGRPGRALIAARVGAVRLIDNDSWPSPAPGAVAPLANPRSHG